MSAEDKEDLIKKTKALLEKGELTEALTSMIEKERGRLGFLLDTLKERPRTFNPYLFKGLSIYREPEALDVKTAELVAVSAAVALRCEHCLEAHITRALDEGAGMDEILDTILISSAIAESSTLSVALRKYKQQEVKQKSKKQSAKNEAADL